MNVKLSLFSDIKNDIEILDDKGLAKTFSLLKALIIRWKRKFGVDNNINIFPIFYLLYFFVEYKLSNW